MQSVQAASSRLGGGQEHMAEVRRAFQQAVSVPHHHRYGGGKKTAQGAVR
jgi:hypothetical protein